MPYSVPFSCRYFGVSSCSNTCVELSSTNHTLYIQSKSKYVISKTRTTRMREPNRGDDDDDEDTKRTILGSMNVSGHDVGANSNILQQITKFQILCPGSCGNVLDISPMFSQS